MNEKNLSEQKSEKEKQPSPVESEVQVEKVREIELAKEKKANSDEFRRDENDTSKILNEKRELSEPLSDDEAKKKNVANIAARLSGRRRGGVNRRFRLALDARRNEGKTSSAHV